MHLKMARAVLAGGVAIGGSLLAASPASAAVEYDCSDFPDQSVAQVVFIEAGGTENDRFRLDRDGDGIACEDQFGGGSKDIEGLRPAEDLGFPLDNVDKGAEPPQGGVDTGAGGTAGGDEAPVLLVGSAVAGAGLMAVAYSRRRRLS